MAISLGHQHLRYTVHSTARVGKNMAQKIEKVVVFCLSSRYGFSLELHVPLQQHGYSERRELDQPAGHSCPLEGTRSSLRSDTAVLGPSYVFLQETGRIDG